VKEFPLQMKINFKPLDDSHQALKSIRLGQCLLKCFELTQTIHHNLQGVAVMLEIITKIFHHFHLNFNHNFPEREVS
jgi:hypothetical protein